MGEPFVDGAECDDFQRVRLKPFLPAIPFARGSSPAIRNNIAHTRKALYPMKILGKILFILNLIIGFYVCCYLHIINPYESCGFENVIILRSICVYCFLASAGLLLLATRYPSIGLYLLPIALTSIPFSLGLHGICEHTSYSHLTGLLFIQVLLPFPPALYRLYTQLSIARTMAVLLFVVIDLYGIIFMPSLINRFL